MITERIMGTVLCSQLEHGPVSEKNHKWPPDCRKAQSCMDQTSRLMFKRGRGIIALLCSLLLVAGDPSVFAQASAAANSSDQGEVTRIPPEQLDSLVAPIALYPDPLLSQTLVASTYPLEIIQLQQWLLQNKTLKDKALAEAVKKQDWDPSIQAMAAVPDVVKRLADDIKWTTDLGNAFLAQQNDVMDAVQRMRKKAQETGNLKSTEQQKVETKVIENKQVLVIQQSSPEVVYVPSYNPTVVYGAPAYPYPPIAYPPPGYYAAGMAISFGIGVAMGAAWGGGWGWNAGWGGNNNVTINNNNNFVNNSNRQNVNNINRSGNGGNGWQHNPKHRGGAPYSDRATARQYGGSSRGDSMSSRQDRARQDQGQRGNREGASASDRSAQGRQERATANDRSGGGRSGPSGSGGAGVGNTSADRGGDRVGNRSTSRDGGSRTSSAFGGGSGASSGSGARASSSRGASSMGGGSRGGRSGGGGRRR
jgi:Protein of unknown function (DUF3300)